MKKHVITFCAIFAALMLLLPLASCGQTGETGDSTAADATTATAEITEAETVDPLENDDIPSNVNYNEEEIDLLVRGNNVKFYSEFYAENITGDTVGDEVYTRELRVVERLGVKINVHLETTVTSNANHGPWKAIETQITAGECEYELVAGSNLNAQSQMVAGRYHNLLNVNTLNFNKNYYAKYVLEKTQINNNLFTCTGDISTFLYDSLYVMFFNRNLCENFGIQATDVYDLVKEGKWTVDKLIELTKNIYVDSDGSQTKNDADTYGLGLVVTSATDALFSACDISILTKDADGNLKFSADIDKIQTLVSRFRTVLWTENCWTPLSENDSYITETIFRDNTQFAEDKICFITERLYFIKSENFRTMKSDYGVLPFPKYNDEQESYGSYLHDQFTVVAIPVTVTADRIEMVGNVIEAMSSDGRKNIKPIYYNVALTTKYARDPQSVNTLDIIFNNIKMDTGWIYTNVIGSIAQGLIRTPIWKNSDTVVSSYNSLLKNSQLKLNQMVKSLDKYTNQ